MNNVRILDDGGDGTTLMEYQGHVLPFGDLDAFPKVHTIRILDDDIILSAYPKAGSHWVFEVIHHLLRNTLDIGDVEKMNTMIESTNEDVFNDLPSPRLLNTHLLLHQLPPDVVNKKVKIVYILRNPRDVAVSYYNFLKVLTRCDYSGKWENFLKPFFQGKYCYGSWFDHTNHWLNVAKTQDLPILMIFFEDVKQNPLREISRLAEFLSLTRDVEFLEQVCKLCSFASMKTRKTTVSGDYAFRKGQVGDWKNWFTQEQVDWFEELYSEKMKDSTINFKYILD